jgi:hypothetical protein
MNWILTRFQEPSTWRGIITLASIFGYSMSPEQGEKIVTAAVALIGLIEVFRKEKGEVKPNAEVQRVEPQSITSPESGRLSENQP